MLQEQKYKASFLSILLMDTGNGAAERYSWSPRARAVLTSGEVQGGLQSVHYCKAGWQG